MAFKIDAAELNYVLAKVFPEVLAVSKLFDFFLRLLKPGSPNKFNISNIFNPIQNFWGIIIP